MVSTQAPTRPLIALLCGLLYLLFTLLPDSSSLMVAWPWVFIWQVAWLCPVLWLLSQSLQGGPWKGLGQGLDWLAGLTMLGLVVSSLAAPFPNQARWYGTIGLCAIAALYALNQWIQTPDRRRMVLTLQGYLSLAFIGVSLILWTSQTWLPELSRLQQIQQATGVSLPFDLKVLEHRNWAPLGHQNYVAGYLTLALPLLVGLAIESVGVSRWIWLGGAGLGLIDLYTTTSRGGWLGLMVALGAIGLLRGIQQFGLKSGRSTGQEISRSGKWWSLGTIGALGLGLIAIASTGRLQGLIDAVTRGGGEVAFRLITTSTGWQMGATHPWTGVGLGGVPLLYQQYRPAWAGSEAEWVFQLHSTPVQLWAELGLWGIAAFVGTIVLVGLIGWRHRSRLSPVTQGVFVGLLAYTVQSLTDYQLDNLCISATIVIFLAAIAAELSEEEAVSGGKAPAWLKFLPIAGSGLVLVLVLASFPVHRAWMLSSQGFGALAQLQAAKTPEEQQTHLKQFTDALTAAAEITPWEPYYPYQLGWNLGEWGLKLNNQDLLAQSIGWFQKGNQASPDQEFGRSNLAWLLLNRDPKAAGQEFARAAQLVPTKPGVFYGLGLSLLYQNKPDLAISAIALEGVRNPAFLTSPIWRPPQQKPLYDQVLNRSEALYSQLIDQSQVEALTQFLRGYRGFVRWWKGDRAGAQADAQASNNPTLQALLSLSEKPSVSSLDAIANVTTRSTLAAWLQPDRRKDLLTQAWVQSLSDGPPQGMIEQLQETMARSESFETWLKQNAPAQPVRFQRAGFGVLSRHIDGPIPKDFFNGVENVGTTVLLPDLFPQKLYYPPFDLLLKPIQDPVIKAAQ